MAFHFRDGLDPEPFVAFVRATVAQCGGSSAKAGSLLGVAEKTVKRWSDGLNSDGIPMEKIREKYVDRVCIRSGSSLFDLYPPPEEEVVEHFCTTCSEWTFTGLDRICSWCADKPKPKVLTSASPSRRCEGCGGRKSPAAVVCRACRTSRGGSGGAPLSRISAEVLEEARELYESGLNFVEIGDAVYGRTRYAHRDSCVHSLRSVFRTRGWLKAEDIAA